jgi:uncharacterized protein with FMN-binding domain
MRRIAFFFVSTVTVVTLLFGYKTSTGASAVAEGTTVAPVGSSSGTSGTSGTSSGTTDTSGGSGSGSGSGSSTVTGDSASTRWGPVQVQLTVTDGVITDVTVVDYPDSNGKDRQINARALPELVQETLDAQSADIDMVSGATVTSEGYLESLQSALDEAGL